MSDESIASEVLSASLGGAISATLLYPLEVLKTKMQAETKSDSSTTTTTTTDDDDTDDKDKDDKNNSNSTTTTTTTTEANRSKYDHQDKSKLTMVEYAQYLYQTQGGMKVFLEGVEMSALQSATEKALYFFAYTGLKNVYRHCTSPRDSGNGGTTPAAAPPTNNTMTLLILGCCAEWAHLPVTLPLDCWTTAIQTNQDPTKKPMQLLLTMLSDKGIKGMYKGIQAYTVLCLKPALQYTIFEQVKAMVVAHRPDGRLKAAEAFMIGMVARTISTICIFPYIRAKVVLQTTKSSSSSSLTSNHNQQAGSNSNNNSNNSSSSISIPQMLREMYEKEGFASWFRGLGPELMRGVLSSALMLMIKDQIGFAVQAALAANQKKKKSLQRA